MTDFIKKNTILRTGSVFFSLFFMMNCKIYSDNGLYVKYPQHVVSEKDIKLLYDITSYDYNLKRRIIKQQIFDAILQQIHNAETFIVMDFFLWNDWEGKLDTGAIHRRLSSELADALIKKKKKQPLIRIVCLTDQINRIYGTDDPPFYEKLMQADIDIVFTDLSMLHDTNKIYSWPAKVMAPAFQLFRWADGRCVSNPFDREPKKVKLSQIFSLLHFKANHRKVVVTDSKANLIATISSFNPADGSSAHSNLGIQIRGRPALDALKSELCCIRWSAKNNGLLNNDRSHFESSFSFIWEKAAQNIPVNNHLNEEKAVAQLVTEGKIKEKILEMFNRTSKGDKARISLFYLSDIKVIKAIVQAAKRGLITEIILDPNRDAFGRKKNGIPNRAVAAILMKHSKNGSIKVRWADTHGEQFHLKAASITNGKNGKYELICGSANWTRRNIGNFNMETDIYLENASQTVSEYNHLFDSLWTNADGLSYTVNYEVYAIKGFQLFNKKVLYFIQESTGLGTF